MSETEQGFQERRARTTAWFILAIMLLLLPFTILQLTESGRWTGMAIHMFGIAAIGLYLTAGLRYLPIPLATMELFLVLLFTVVATVHQSGGVLTASATLYSVMLFSVGLVLVDRQLVLIATALTMLAYGFEAALEFGGFLSTSGTGPLIVVQANQSLFFKLFITTLQLTLIALVGLLTGIVTYSLQKRVRALEEARSEASAHALSTERLAEELREKVSVLGRTEETLRQTVEELSVPVLPLRAGASLMPLVGHIDAQRSDRLVKVLLDAVYERRSQLVIIDLTAVLEATDLLSSTLTRMAQGVRLLGAELVLAGLQPAFARLLVSKAEHLQVLRSFQSLEQAIDYALEQQAAQRQ